MGVARNTFYNLTGSAAAVLVTLVTVPLYLQQIGEARYGVMALVWLLLGYFGLFDLGLARATANYIARLKGASDPERSSVFWTAALLNLGFGCLGGCLLYFVGGPLFSHWLKSSVDIHAEAVAILPWVAAAVPLATSTGVLTGTLTGCERFGIVNVWQTIGLILFQTLPLAAAFLVGPQLTVIVPAAVAARLLSVVPFGVAVARVLPLKSRPMLATRKARELLGYGSWVTVSSTIGPILSTFDRLFIGATLGAATVAYYDVPHKVVRYFSLLPSALSGALFPRLSGAGVSEANALAIRATRLLGGVLVPVVVAAMFLFHPAMTLWVGESFANRAGPIGEILLIGVWVNVFALVPFAMLQARGRPDLVAKVYLLQVLPYLAALWWSLHAFGVIGAAWVWSVRAAADAVLLVTLTDVRWQLLREMWLSVLLTLCSWCVVYFADSHVLMRVLVGVCLFLCACVASVVAAPDVYRRVLQRATSFGKRCIDGICRTEKA